LGHGIRAWERDGSITPVARKRLTRNRVVIEKRARTRGTKVLVPQLRLFPVLIETGSFGGADMPHINRIALVFAFVLSLFASAPQRAAAETSELMKAIEANDVRWVRALIAAGANVKNDVRHLREAVWYAAMCQSPRP
jgi:hypothetical protein